MTKYITTSVLALMLLAGCGEDTCKTICVQCGATDQADCREACVDAYKGTYRCRDKMRNLEECLQANSCQSSQCQNKVNIVEGECSFHLDDYIADDSGN